jgi:hypothetical protein
MTNETGSPIPHFSGCEYRCQPGLHRPGYGGSLPSHRVYFGLQALTVKSRLLPGEKCLRTAKGANPWQPTILSAECGARNAEQESRTLVVGCF